MEIETWKDTLTLKGLNAYTKYILWLLLINRQFSEKNLSFNRDRDIKIHEILLKLLHK